MYELHLAHLYQIIMASLITPAIEKSLTTFSIFCIWQFFCCLHNERDYLCNQVDPKPNNFFILFEMPNVNFLGGILKVVRISLIF